MLLSKAEKSVEIAVVTLKLMVNISIKVMLLLLAVFPGKAGSPDKLKRTVENCSCEIFLQVGCALYVCFLITQLTVSVTAVKEFQ